MSILLKIVGVLVGLFAIFGGYLLFRMGKILKKQSLPRVYFEGFRMGLFEFGNYIFGSIIFLIGVGIVYEVLTH